MGAPRPTAIGPRVGTIAAVIVALGVALVAAAPARAAIDEAERVADINPGGSASIVTATPLGRFVIFGAFDGVSGTELWRSDGTAAGTTRVADINPGAPGSSPAVITALNGRVLFSAFEPVGGDELWGSDGTAAGTARIRDIEPGAASSQPRSLTRVGEQVMFAADDGVAGTELWRSDGTAAGTARIADINPGAGNGVSAFLFPGVRGGQAFFAATEPVAGSELWRSDTTGAGTELVANIALAGGSSPRLITPAGDWIYFTADDNIVGRELWRSDGEPGGTHELVEDFDGAATDSDVTSLSAFGGRAYFSALSAGNGLELQRSTVPGPGAELVADVNPVGDSEPQSLTPAGGRLLFTAVSGASGRELWHSDGVPGGTTEKVEEINPGGSGPCAIPYVTALGNEVFFCANDGAHGSELWRSDGTAAGTELVTDINPGAAGSSPSGLSVHGDTLYFSADDGTGSELWAVDTGAPETSLLDAPAAGSHIADPTPALEVDSPAIDLERFQCSDGSGYSACASRNGMAVAGPLGDGATSLTVRAVDVRGNADPSPVAVPAFTVDTTGPWVKAKGRKLRLEAGRRGRLKLRCAASELTGPCRAKVVVKTRMKVRSGGQRKRFTLARGRAEIDPGQRTRAKLRLRREVRRLVATSPRARRVRIVIEAKDGLGNERRTGKRMKLVLPR